MRGGTERKQSILRKQKSRNPSQQPKGQRVKSLSHKLLKYQERELEQEAREYGPSHIHGLKQSGKGG